MQSMLLIFDTKAFLLVLKTNLTFKSNLFTNKLWKFDVVEARKKLPNFEVIKTVLVILWLDTLTQAF